MERSVRYAWNQDVALAYEVVGEGPVDLLLLAGAPSNLDVQWEDSRYAAFLRRLADGRRLIITDRRGTGLSDRFSPSAIPPVEALKDDLLRVLDAARSDRAVVLSWNETTMVAQLFAATHPGRCAGLIMLDPTVAWLPTDDMPWLPDRSEQEALLADHRTRWGVLLSDDFADMDDGERAWYMRLQRATTSPGAFVAEERRWMETDMRSLLPAIHVPTLVLADQDGTGYSDPESGRYVAERIPSARLVPYHSHDQHVWRAPADAILAETSAFIASLGSDDPVHDRVLATVLFTDIVDSSAHAGAAGDRAWRAVREQHDAMTRAAVARFRGREIKTLGDGFLVTFDAPARAVRCAQEITSGAGPLGIEIRAGLHTGEIELDGVDVAGIAVAIAARVSALAGPGEVLVSGTIKDLTAGSGIVFDDRGVHELKGIPDSWRVYAAS
jgi:class 3 adenylate cyclase